MVEIGFGFGVLIELLIECFVMFELLLYVVEFDCDLIGCL